MKTSIVWFTTDLRLTDNPVLTKAIKESDEVIPVYCFDDAHFATTPYGFQKTGSFRAQFLLETISDLQVQLQEVGSQLILLRGNPAIEIPKLALAQHVDIVFAKNELAAEEIQTQEHVRKNLHCSFTSVASIGLVFIEDLPFSVAATPDIFTSFRKEVEKKNIFRTPLAKPTKIQSPKNLSNLSMAIPTLKDLGVATIFQDARAALHFKGGASAGAERLQHYLFESHGIATYKLTRNGLIGADYSSKFSAWLANGSLSPLQIYAAIKDYEAKHTENESTYWLIFELLWREYFRIMLLKYGNLFFVQQGIKGGTAKMNKHDSHVFEKWKLGQTGKDFVDANMKELNATGFMSNRGRQNVASYLCHDLQLDWRYGAAYFEQQLIDYDVSSNWCNWSYVAGVGNDLRPNRIFNIDKQAKDYDADGAYRKLWLK